MTFVLLISLQNHVSKKLNFVQLTLQKTVWKMKVQTWKILWNIILNNINNKINNLNLKIY